MTWRERGGRHFVFRDLSATVQTKNMKTLSHLLLPDVRKSIALFEGSMSSPACPSDKSHVEMQMSVEHWWNDTCRGKRKYWERNVSQCHFMHHKSYMD